MFWKPKQRAWYWSVLVLFFVLRMLFRLARFFLRAADNQALWDERRAAKKVRARRSRTA